jgi:hypothetical protein
MGSVPTSRVRGLTVMDLESPRVIISAKVENSGPSNELGKKQQIIDTTMSLSLETSILIIWDSV